MRQVRKYIILLLNLLVIGWILKVWFFDTNSDTASVFVVFSIVFLILFDAYAVLIINLFNRMESKNIGTEIGFYICLFLPFIALYKCTG